MQVQQFIKKEFKVVHPYDAVQTVKSYISDHTAVVVMENDKHIGILTSYDLMVKHHNLVIDCIKTKTTVTAELSVKEALNIMKAEKTEVLPVYDNGSFTGVIFKNDILDTLQQTIEEHSELVSTIVHDLKTPIANIIGLTSLLKLNVAKEDNKRLLTFAEEACKQATALINDLLNTAHQKNQAEQKVTNTELFAFLTDTVNMMRGYAHAKEVELETEIPEGEFYSQIDKVEFRRAIENVISNAIKFSPYRGTVTVSGMLHEQGGILIKIKDRGIGIPKARQDEVFHKFSPARRNGTQGEASTGLGMFITKRIVESYGGKIWLESTEGKGTTLFIEMTNTEKIAPQSVSG
jgi:signal transduction histidine kinase